MEVRKIRVPRLDVSEFISYLNEEKEGFSFGNPWRCDEKSLTCVVPILRALDEVGEPGYLTLGASKFHVIKDSGNINEVLFKNNEKVPLFVRMGELFEGGTQERSAVMSIIVFPDEEVKIKVVCSHASKPISMSASMEARGYTPGRDALYLSSMRKGALKQADSWAADRSYHQASTSSMSRSSSCSLSSKRGIADRGISDQMVSAYSNIRSDNVKEYRNAYNEAFDAVLKEVPLFESQVGMVMIDQDGFYCLDSYDIHASWKAVKEAIMGKEAVAITQIDSEDVFQFNPDKVRGLISKVLSNKISEEKDHFHVGGAKTITFKLGDKHVGEVVTLEDSVIHLLIVRG